MALYRNNTEKNYWISYKGYISKIKQVDGKISILMKVGAENKAKKESVGQKI